MDCTDIVIGMARGPYSRIMDYYTRDRSTPRVDSFWGGEDDLTAAVGEEENGVTTIAFRKKLKANGPTDHSIEDKLMTTIWARGQQPGNYIHRPDSGLEKGEKSIADFYRPDELKYHGQGNQRGVVTMNFMEEEEIESRGKCGGEWKYPRSCVPPACEYRAVWEYKQATDSVAFTIQSIHTNKWTGIGFSNSTKMPTTDAVIGWVDSDGRPFVADMWVTAYIAPQLDEQTRQDIVDVNATVTEGVTTIQFTRKRDTGDEKDMSFKDQCLYFFFPVKGGTFDKVSKRIAPHVLTPVVSAERICIQSCGVKTEVGDISGDEINEVVPQQYSFKVEVKLKDEKLTSKGSKTYDDLKNRVKRSIENVLRSLPGFQSVNEIKFETDRDDNVLARIDLIFDKETLEDKSEQPPKQMVQRKLEETVATGQIGNLRVDPQYLRVTNPEVVQVEEEHSSQLSDKDIKFWTIIACVAALVLIAIIQAACTIYRLKRTPPPKTSKATRLH